MKKELKIKVRLDSEFVIEGDPDLDDWNNAGPDEKELYLKERVKEFLIDQIDDIVDDLIETNNIQLK